MDQNEQEEGVFWGKTASSLFLKYHAMLENESDKGAVLVASGVIEEGLKQTIEAFLIKSESRKDPLFYSDNAPLSTLSAKIEMAYRLGLFGDLLRDQLNNFRKLRNEFAHDFNKTSLSEPDVANRVNIIFNSNPELFSSLTGIMRDSGNEEPTIREKFNMYFACQMMAIIRTSMTTKRLKDGLES